MNFEPLFSLASFKCNVYIYTQRHFHRVALHLLESELLETLFRCMGMGRLTVPLFVSMSGPLFTLEKQLTG